MKANQVNTRTQTSTVECDSPELTTPSDELRKLHYFTGHWRMEGKNLDENFNGAHSDVVGEEHYEWLPGAFFLSGKWSREASGFNHQGISLIGFDTQTAKFHATNFDNLGHERRYEVKGVDRRWELIGDAEKAVIEFSADGHSLTENWMVKQDDGTWKPLCDLRGVRMNYEF